MENGAAPRVERYLSKIKVIRRIAGKIITFLAQLENFQKTLWLKKKFVVETQYCSRSTAFRSVLPGDRRQRRSARGWVRLFAIDEIKGDSASPGCSKPLSVEFLKGNSSCLASILVFGDTFTARLVESIEDFDARLDGILTHSDNFKALSLLGKRYREQVKCIYIDPPYNTAVARPYKNNYRHASWVTIVPAYASPLYSPHKRRRDFRQHR